MRKQVKLAFLGDSVTEGCFELYPTDYGFDTVRRPEDGYVAKTINALRKKYGEQAILYENFGKSGMSANGASEAAESAVCYAPDIAVLCFGLNDALHPERYGAALARLLGRLTDCIEKVIFLTPNMMATSLAPDLLPEARKAAEALSAAQRSGTFDRMMAEALSLCRQYGVPVCDMYKCWKERAEDGIDISSLLSNRINHPTAAMHDETAALLFPFLTEAIDGYFSSSRLTSRS